MTQAEAEARRRRLAAGVLDLLGERRGEWVSFTDLLALAPAARVRVNTEEGDTPFGYDSPRGPVYDAGPSGEPDAEMLADVLRTLAGAEMLAEERLAQPGGPGTKGVRQWRLLDMDAPVGLDEIAGWLHVKRGTADLWRHRGVLPAPEPTTVGGRPWWRRRAVRDWALATGRAPR